MSTFYRLAMRNHGLRALHVAGAFAVGVDSDLDWGQDMKRLVRALKDLRVQHFYMAVMYSGDDSKLDLPAWDGLPAYQPVKGWVAISYTMLKSNGWWIGHLMGRNDSAYAWLERYQPAARVGKSILLYYIPEASDVRRAHTTEARLMAP